MLRIENDIVPGQHGVGVVLREAKQRTAQQGEGSGGNSDKPVNCHRESSSKKVKFCVAIKHPVVARVEEIFHLIVSDYTILKFDMSPFRGGRARRRQFTWSAR